MRQLTIQTFRSLPSKVKMLYMAEQNGRRAVQDLKDAQERWNLIHSELLGTPDWNDYCALVGRDPSAGWEDAI